MLPCHAFAGKGNQVFAEPFSCKWSQQPNLLILVFFIIWWLGDLLQRKGHWSSKCSLPFFMLRAKIWLRISPSHLVTLRYVSLSPSCASCSFGIKHLLIQPWQRNEETRKGRVCCFPYWRWKGSTGPPMSPPPPPCWPWWGPNHSLLGHQLQETSPECQQLVKTTWETQVQLDRCFVTTEEPLFPPLSPKENKTFVKNNSPQFYLQVFLHSSPLK